jgi:bifunctional DNA-binding transcriptional regulator/antitoxin component of YhaV-PrlF toxin-antitoxin module
VFNPGGSQGFSAQLHVRKQGKVVLHYHRHCYPLKWLLMTTLTVTTKGQVTFKKDVLRHLGIKPGEKIARALVRDDPEQSRAAAKFLATAEIIAVPLLKAQGQPARLP